MAHALRPHRARPDRATGRPPARFAQIRDAGLALILALILALSAGVPAAAARALRVCADPNNLPFSNQREQGFENRIVALIARDLGADVTYTWWAERRGFIRNTLTAGLCDLVPGIPATSDQVRVTPPYYRSAYVFVTRASAPLVTSFDDPSLHHLRIGVQMIGNDHFNTPPAHALARRAIIDNVRGYSVYGNYASPDPPARILDALVAGEIDVAAVWGPLAGYAVKARGLPLHYAPVSPLVDDLRLPMVFDISMGVRRDDLDLWHRVSGALAAHRDDIASILAEYGVPRIE